MDEWPTKDLVNCLGYFFGDFKVIWNLKIWGFCGFFLI